MTTYAQFKTLVLNLLGSDLVAGPPLHGTDYSAQLLSEATAAALDGLLPKVWKRASATLALGSSTYTLPADLYQIQAVRDTNSGAMIPPVTLSQSLVFGAELMSGNGWLEYPEGSLTFSDSLDYAATLYYAARWPAPSGESAALAIPDYALTAAGLYAASYCLLPQATLAGSLAQYKTRVDSGQPTDNPLTDLSSYFLKRFEIEMGKLPLRRAGEP